MKILVTGGAGFIGGHLVSALVADGAEVLVLDNLRRGSLDLLTPMISSGAVQFVTGDIRDNVLVKQVMHGVERVYHLAAQSNVLGAIQDLDYSFTTNVLGTYAILSAAHAEGVNRVIFTSSREIYGEVESLPVAEERPLRPKNAYGASKAAGEIYCRVFQDTYGLDVSVLRLANVYGPGDRDRVIPIWLDRARQGKGLELYGGSQTLDLVPIATVVAALRRAAETKMSGQAVNVGSGVGTTLRDLAAHIQGLSGVHVGLRILPPRSVEVTRFIADVTRMRTLLGIIPDANPLAGLAALWDEFTGSLL